MIIATYMLKLINEKSKDKSKKKVLLSAIVNTAIRANNMPDQDTIILIAEYQSKRNVYRSPVNYIVQGLIHGFTRIVPGKGVQNIINKDDKKGKRAKKVKNLELKSARELMSQSPDNAEHDKKNTGLPNR